VAGGARQGSLLQTCGESIMENRKCKQLLRVTLEAFIGRMISSLLVKAVIAIGVISVSLSYAFVDTIRDDELVMLQRWGALQHAPVEPGLRWFWPIMDKMRRYDTRPRKITVTDEYQSQEYNGIASLTK